MQAVWKKTDGEKTILTFKTSLQEKLINKAGAADRLVGRYEVCIVQ
jgi:hypothetical protein